MSKYSATKTSTSDLLKAESQIAPSGGIFKTLKTRF